MYKSKQKFPDLYTEAKSALASLPKQILVGFALWIFMLSATKGEPSPEIVAFTFILTMLLVGVDEWLSSEATDVSANSSQVSSVEPTTIVAQGSIFAVIGTLLFALTSSIAVTILGTFSSWLLIDFLRSLYGKSMQKSVSKRSSQGGQPTLLKMSQGSTLNLAWQVASALKSDPQIGGARFKIISKEGNEDKGIHPNCIYIIIKKENVSNTINITQIDGKIVLEGQVFNEELLSRVVTVAKSVRGIASIETDRVEIK
ncbi:BON domain-containing protein [Gloeobacter violaceus]|uniref:BON domain-containing protein n=1 Tax=Gloeobacter violaceus TaxID=33072 RepID=UPI0013E8CDB4|nr:BON domain-containing protein [Gloeobacter violaceus]